MILLTACLKESRSETRQSIPQNGGHRKEGKLIIVCSSMNLPVGKRVHVRVILMGQSELLLVTRQNDNHSPGP